MTDSITPMGKRRDERKNALDQQTSYQTLLPHMDEGFHVGYQHTPGIVSDRNQHPREWLENVARYMQTQGEDVGYSIPDVLASEQQLRRLSRLPHELAMRHQEMIDYRAVLAILLLWDGWSKDDSWPELTLTPLLSGHSEFSKSISAALSGTHAHEGLYGFTLSARQTELPKIVPLCLLSRSMVLMPAANPGDLSAILPPCVQWYDRARGRFLDPCNYLSELDRVRLVRQLRLLQLMNEHESLGSVLYSPDAQLCALLNRFADDLLSVRKSWREQLENGNPDAEAALRTRLLAVCGLKKPRPESDTAGSPSPASRITQKTARLDTSDLLNNPLIRALFPSDATPVPAAFAPLLTESNALSFVFLDDLPLAVVSDCCMLEPCGMSGENEALMRAQQECTLLERFNPEWCHDVGSELHALAAQLNRRVGANQRALSLLKRWSDELSGKPAQGDRGVMLHYPMSDYPDALCALLRETLGLTDRACIENPFSDCLIFLTDAEQSPFDSRTLSTSCLVQQDDASEARYALPPLSPSLCRWLQSQSERNDPCAAQLLPQSFRFVFQKHANAIEAGFQIVSRTRGDGTALTNAVTFVRSYPLHTQPQSGAAFPLPAQAAPYVAIWPTMRFPPGQWKRYYVYTHRPDAVDVWAFCSGSEKEPDALRAKQGELRSALDEPLRGRRDGDPAKSPPAVERRWQTLQTDRYPAFVMLKRGELSLGALLCDRPHRPIKHEPAAVVSIDFGSIATTAMLRQGDKVQPAVLPRCMHHSLLCPLPGDDAFLTDELLPKNILLPGDGNPSTFYSVMDMFVDQPKGWQHPLVDGHIYYRESLNALFQKGENTLYYDMKWGAEEYALRCMRLFLKQVMLQAALSARLWGSPSVSWRVSMPSALPLDKQAAYLEIMRSLSHELAAETGLPLTTGIPPVLYATENQADGLYFLGRNEVNARGGYLNIDIGGSTSDLSLWLGGAQRAAIECSLVLGCRQMLFDSLCLWHLSDFEQDFNQATETAKACVSELTRALKRGAATVRGQQKSMFLLDDFFANRAPDIREVMEKTRGEGRVTYVESLLLFNIGFLFYLCGELLQRAFDEADLKPLLPERMELCIAGNGGQLLKCFDDEQRQKLCCLALSRLSPDHPLTVLLPVQSHHPKQEVAIGLLSGEDHLQSALQPDGRWNGTPEGGSPDSGLNPVSNYLPIFFSAFPLAARRLMPNVFEDDARHGGATLTPTAVMELTTIFENERFKSPQDDMATYVRCFAGLKRLWRI